ncbi:MAG: hypothetical protein WAX04_09105 [Oscillospiraceae bacterium]
MNKVYKLAMIPLMISLLTSCSLVVPAKENSSNTISIGVSIEIKSSQDVSSYNLKISERLIAIITIKLSIVR